MEAGRLDVGLREGLKREKKRGLRALTNAHVSLEDGAKYGGSRWRQGDQLGSCEKCWRRRAESSWRGLYRVELPALSVR